MNAKLPLAAQHDLGVAVDQITHLITDKKNEALVREIRTGGQRIAKNQSATVEVAKDDGSGVDPEHCRWDLLSPPIQVASTDRPAVHIALAQNEADKHLLADVYSDDELLAQVPLNTGDITANEISEYEQLFDSTSDPKVVESVVHLAEAIDALDQDAAHSRADLLVKLTDKLTPTRSVDADASKLTVAAQEQDALHHLHDGIERLGHIASPNVLAVGAATAESLSHGPAGDAVAQAVGVSTASLEGLAHGFHLAAEALHGLVGIVDTVHVINGIREGHDKTDIALDGSRATLAFLSVAAGLAGWPALVGIGLSVGIVGVTIGKIFRGRKRHEEHRQQAGHAVKEVRQALDKAIQKEHAARVGSASPSTAPATAQPSPA